MVDRRKIAFEENTLPRKSVKELFVRNSQQKIELDNVYKQLNKGREDCKERFVKSRFELLHQLKQRRGSLPLGTDGARAMSSDQLSGRFSQTNALSPPESKGRSKTFCSGSHVIDNHDVWGIKPKSKSLSEILPPMKLPPIHVQQRRPMLGSRTKGSMQAHGRTTNKDTLSKSRVEPGRPVATREIGFDDLNDCRYLRGRKAFSEYAW